MEAGGEDEAVYHAHVVDGDSEDVEGWGSGEDGVGGREEVLEGDGEEEGAQEVCPYVDCFVVESGDGA